MIERGADPNAGVDSSGTCLTIVEYNHGEKSGQMQALLREHGAVMPPYAMDDAALERAMREGEEGVADPQLLHEVMGRDNPALIGLFLDTTPNAGELFQLTDIWGGNYPSDPDTIRALADRGVDMRRANWIGRTFLHGCAEKGDVAAARVFSGTGGGYRSGRAGIRGYAPGRCRARGAGGDGAVSAGPGIRPGPPGRVALGAAAIPGGEGGARRSGGAARGAAQRVGNRQPTGPALRPVPGIDFCLPPGQALPLKRPGNGRHSCVISAAKVEDMRLREGRACMEGVGWHLERR